MEKKTLLTLSPHRIYRRPPPPQPLLPRRLTVAGGLLEGRSTVREFGGGGSRGDGGIAVQAVGHLVTNEVNEALEGLLHVDVVLGAGLEEFKSFGRRTWWHRAWREGTGTDQVLSYAGSKPEIFGGV